MLGIRAVVAGVVLVGLLTSTGAAQDDPDGEWRAQEAAESDVEWESPPESEAPTLEEEQAGFAEAEERSKTDPYEDPSKAHYFLGLFYRHTWTPAFVLKLFLDEVSTANNPGTGLEFTYRKDNLDITGTFFWQRYNTYGPFLASGDPPEDTEMIDSSLSMMAVGANFLWSTPFNDVVALQYGLDVAIGMVLGDLRRTEAYRTSDGGDHPRSVDGWAPCNGPGDPVGGGFCDPTSVDDGEDGGHYDVEARRWTDGGSVPNVWFRFAIPHIALRIKPIAQLVMRVDAGFDLFSGFFVGTAIGAGLN
ncbi:MAG: hypothetical protein ACOCXM_08400 [Myxococcota bacterium]